jgi:uncharacterized membrane protein YcaP (DUF421 family)
MCEIIYGINFHDLLVPGISIAEKILRPAAVYFILIIGLRIAGKREMAQLNTFDMIVLLSLANAVQNAIIGNDNSLTGGIIGAVTLLVINHFVIKVLYSHENLQHFIEGEPDVLVKNGKVRMNRLKKELITVEELTEAAHKQGISSLSEVENAILDPNGSLCFITKEPTPEIIRHTELMKKLDILAEEINIIKAELSKIKK